MLKSHLKCVWQPSHLGVTLPPSLSHPDTRFGSYCTDTTWAPCDTWSRAVAMVTLTDSEHIQAKVPSQTYLSLKRPPSMTVGCVLYANISCHNSVCLRGCVLCANVTAGVCCCCRSFVVGAQGLCANVSRNQKVLLLQRFSFWAQGLCALC